MHRNLLSKLKKTRWGRALAAASVCSALAVAWAGSSDSESQEKTDARVAQSATIPRPPMGGARAFGASASEPAPLGKLQPAHQSVDVSVSTSLGGFSLVRYYNDSSQAWRTNKRGQGYLFAQPFGRSLSASSESNSLHWWHSLYSYVSVDIATCSRMQIEDGELECFVPLWTARTPSGSALLFDPPQEGCPSAGSCFGVSGKEQDAKLERHASGFTLHAPEGRYHYEHFFNDASMPVDEEVYFLSSIEDVSYAGCTSGPCTGRRVTLSYGSPEACQATSTLTATRDAHEPYVLLATLIDGQKLRFNYQRMASLNPYGGSEECVLSSVSLLPAGSAPGAAGTQVVQYAYAESGGVTKAGLLAAAHHPESNRTTTYAYSVNGQPAWVVREGLGNAAQVQATGKLITQKLLSPTRNYILQDASAHMSYAVDAENNRVGTVVDRCYPGSFGPPTVSSSSCRSSQWQYFDTDDVDVGDGSGLTAHMRHEFFMAQGAGSSFGPLVMQSVARCTQTGRCAGLTSEQNRAWGVGALAVPGSVAPGATVKVGTQYKNGNGAYTLYQSELPDSSTVPQGLGFLPPAETRTVRSGASSPSGTDALMTKSYSYDYGPVWEQRVKTETRDSVLVPGAQGLKAVTTYRHDVNNHLKAIIQSGYTQRFDVATGSWSQTYRSIGTFFRTAHTCGARAGLEDPLGRTVEVEGPCWVSGTSATSCDAGGAAPRTQYEYHPATLANDTAGRLALSRTFPTSSCDSATALSTTYESYDPRGHALSVLDSNGVRTTYTYQGGRVVESHLAGQTTHYGYDDGTHGDYIQQPNGDYEVLCYRVNTPGVACAGGQQTDTLQWKASSSRADGAVWTEKVVYGYRHGVMASETFLDSSGATRRTRRYESDPLGRPSFLAWGNSNAGFALTALFDVEGNRIAMGVPHQTPSGSATPPAFCAGTPGASLCKWMQYDRLNRLSSLQEKTSPSESTRTCMRYDGHGNVAGVKAGCTGLTSCDTCDRSETFYRHDDFGRLASMEAPWTHDGLGGDGTLRFEFDASGNMLRKQTPAMAHSSPVSWLEFSHDMMGRILQLEAVSAGTRQTLFSYAYDASVSVPAGCPAPATSHTRGRIQVRSDSFGDSWFQYDAQGRVLATLRRRAAPGVPARTGTCSTDNTHATPNSFYHYDAQGRLVSETYPHGRVVHYGYYPAGGGWSNKVASIAVELWDTSTSSTTLHPLISEVKWEPYGSVRAYQLHAPLAAQGNQVVSVEYLQGGNNQPITSCSTQQSVLTASPDGSGRSSGLWVSSGTLSGSRSGDVFKRAYTWKANQLLQEDTCLLDTNASTPLSVRYAGSDGTLGYDGRGALVRVSRPSGQFALRGGTLGQRSYSHDSRGNPTYETQDCWQFAYSTTHSDRVTDRQLVNKVCGTNMCGYSNGLRQQFEYDGDGRVTRKTLRDVSRGLTLDSLTFDASSLEPTATPGPGEVHAAVGAVYRSVTDGSNRTYEYFYDAHGRRRLKRYSTGVEDEFFYGAERLLVDRGNTSLLPGGDFVLDDYVWLDGRPVAFIRSRFDSGWQRQLDLTGSCNRNGEPTACGVYFLVADYLGKPVLALDSQRRVSFVADYEPHGHVNRVTSVGDTAHSYAPNTNTVLGYFNQQHGLGMRAQLRARYDLVETASGDYTYLSSDFDNELTTISGASTRLSGAAQANVLTGWVDAPANGRVHARFRANADGATGFGAALAGYEYRRFQQGASPIWTPLRYPGQYHDAETDLFENYNRFYDPGIGRYLAPDPLLQNPSYAVGEAAQGVGVLTYGYANNNPINLTDPSGLIVDFDLSPEDIDALKKQTGMSVNDLDDYFREKIGAEYIELADNPEFKATIKSVSLFDEKTVKQWKSQVDNQGASTEPLSGWGSLSVVNLTQAASPEGQASSTADGRGMGDRFWGDPKGNLLTGVLAHELGHAWSYMKGTGWPGSVVSVESSLRWENAVRPKPWVPVLLGPNYGGPRLRH